jgi:DNA-binding Lrp family transcriptional regulator
MSKGVSSYEELARDCNVTRSTIYRRIANLEKEKIITRQTHVGVDFEKLNIVAVDLRISVSRLDEERTVETLKKYEEIKIVWRTYGACNLAVILFCNKGDEGKTISKMREILENLNVISFEFCVGYSWEKLDLTPF